MVFMLLPRAILHDETVFEEPDQFKPERFINKSLPDPADSGAFGFGRRWVTCSLWMSSVLITLHGPD